MLLVAGLAGSPACTGPSGSPEPAGTSGGPAPAPTAGPARSVLPHPSEVHLRNLRQLTFSGENAEAYFSPDGQQIIFQSTREPYACDQQFTMNLDGANVQLVSTGRGRTTCGYYTAGGRIIYASTHLGGAECPPAPDRALGYVWPLYRTFDIFSANPDGTDITRLTDADGYDAEGTVSPDGRKIVFTSTRDGDLELYTMNVDGSEQTRLTFDKGYDGGAFFSPDSQWIVYRASHPTESADIAAYDKLIAQDLVMPDDLEIWVMRADGGEKRRVTSLGGANWAPFFHPSGTRIIFASDRDNASPYVPNFELYLINLDGTGLERVTFDEAFDGFPIFSPDGSKLLFASNRFAEDQGDTNIFLADWVE
jgi:Tol biopolymer transport system component